MNQRELLKQAFVLGVFRAAKEAGIEKTAIVGEMLGKFAPKLLSGAKFLAYGGGPLAEKFAPATQRYLTSTLASGGLGAIGDVLGGDKSRPWYERAGRGYLGGALAGAAFQGGVEGTRGAFARLGKSQWLGSRAPELATRMTQWGAHTPGYSRIGDIWNYAKGGGTVPEAAKRFGMYAAGGIPLTAAGLWAGGKGTDVAGRIMGEVGGAAGAGAIGAGELRPYRPPPMPMAYNFVPPQGQPYPQTF